MEVPSIFGTFPSFLFFSEERGIQHARKALLGMLIRQSEKGKSIPE